jgi:hypothetical protein
MARLTPLVLRAQVPHELPGVVQLVDPPAPSPRHKSATALDLCRRHALTSVSYYPAWSRVAVCSSLGPCRAGPPGLATHPHRQPQSACCTLVTGEPLPSPRRPLGLPC